MRWLSLAVLTILLSGCALPPVFTAASLMADAISYASTGKSVADHGISMVLQKDCALLRGFDGEICIEPDAADQFADSLAFDTDPVVASSDSDLASDNWLAELSYLSDSLGSPG